MDVLYNTILLIEGPVGEKVRFNFLNFLKFLLKHMNVQYKRDKETKQIEDVIKDEEFGVHSD